MWLATRRPNLSIISEHGCTYVPRIVGKQEKNWDFKVRSEKGQSERLPLRLRIDLCATLQDRAREAHRFAIGWVALGPLAEYLI